MALDLQPESEIITTSVADIGIVIPIMYENLIPVFADIDSETFNITYGNSRTIADLAQVVKSLIPNVILEERPRAQDKPIRGTLATDHALETLDFKAKWSMEDGYKKYCEWYIDQWDRVNH